MSHQTDLAVSSEHVVRKEKVTRLAEQGIAAWPTAREATHTAQQAKDLFIGSNDDQTVVRVAGRLMSKRGHGKTVFAHLQDRSGRVQLYLRSDVLSPSAYSLVEEFVDLGDIVWCEGTMFVTKTGEVSLKVADIVLLSKCLHPLPDKFHGLTHTEQRYRQRYLDIMCNEDSRKKFVQRSLIVQEIRQQLLKYDFLEVETPMLHPIPGGAAARPFVTHHNAYDMELFLRIAPELYLKTLVVGGLDRVFEINRNFRNEGVSTKHNPEFTMLEFYMAHGTYLEGMALTERLCHAVAQCIHGSGLIPYGEHTLDFASPFARYTVAQSLEAVGGLAPHELAPEMIDATLQRFGVLDTTNLSYGQKQYLLFEEVVESKLVQPTFITDFPVEVSPLAKRHEHTPELVARFELFVAGMELANCFSELNDPFEQAERFHDQARQRAAGDDEAHFFDADYVRALEYGLPPTVGVGIGIDRLVMLMTDTTSIKDVILFPTMRRLE